MQLIRCKTFVGTLLLMAVPLAFSACGANGGNNGGTGGGGGSFVPQAATHFSLTAPATVSPSSFFNVNVLALDASNNTVAGYSGIVHFTSTDPHAVVPGNTSLTNGAGTFLATLATLGNQTITATDTVTASITGASNSIDVETNSNLHGFQPTGNMGVDRVAHTATLLQSGKVLITGGYNANEVLPTAQIYDPGTGAFTPTGNMTTPRFAHTATLLQNGKVLIAGGSPGLGDLSGGDNSDDLSTAELFDPATGTFTATGAMNEPHSEHAAALLANGKVLVVGGSPGNVAELYDPATGTFTPTTGQLIVGGRWGCTATLLNDGTVLIAGGRDDEDVWDGYPLNDAELFDPATGNFTATGAMNQFRYNHTATLLNNGKVLVTGGFNGSPVPDAELFDPAAGSFSGTGNMGTPRADHTATLLNDGTVLVAGGFSYTPPGSFSSAEVFDPATNKFAPTGPMGAPRFGHTATLLNSGLVLVTGGQSSITIPEAFTDSADLYN
ncbi:MAG TPA: kelch repeat-containing protein [Candidatus Limnocylindrales bacterium]|nr:kelch repeat-containing protein [Candidatus Limnocylindrales bacterium]